MGDPPTSQKRDYYTTLGIPKTATLSEICNAYKVLVKKWHPAKHHSNRGEAGEQFQKITEAYRVLSSKKREESAIPILLDNESKTPKASKNTFHEKNKDDEFYISSPRSASPTGLEINASHHTSKGKKNKKSKKPKRADAYGSSPKSESENPSLSRVGTQRISGNPIIYSQSTARRKPQPIEKKLECTLEELLQGCVKHIKITRDTISENGHIAQEEETLKIRVKPGWKKGTKITFEDKGDEKPGSLPADIIFVINEKRHPIFKREGDDLQLGVEVPLIEAVTGCTITVPLLGGEEMTLSFDEILYPGYVKVIPGQGMPKPKQEGKKGDLRLNFLVKFPRELSDDQRSNVKNILNECS
ncbi:putative HSP40/DnaJ peptide-binding protein [Heracleum sosnowskyi]|uniref:HSP40/DnaJ peptide-binding protein n=1 Tax=Heracleum sosnowskyi TaxID=360622 RepID=A0AAD8HVK7_9APIA|nr:putative HSP40/DnaJ peptide-binding protein [Heracleum sosnowskyi]